MQLYLQAGKGNKGRDEETCPGLEFLQKRSVNVIFKRVMDYVMKISVLQL